MKQSQTESSTEQYIRKTNKVLFFVGMGLLTVFLIVLAGIYGHQSHQEVITPIDYGTDVDTLTGTSTVPEEVESADASITVVPNTLDMPNVPIGTEAEIPVLITAEAGSIQIRDIQLAEVQKDGFEVQLGTCDRNMKLEKGDTCTFKVLWNPLSLRYIQNLVNITWREDNSLTIKENVLHLPIKAQSAEPKECVVCESNIRQDLVPPRQVIGLTGGIIGQVDNDGYLNVGNEKYKVSTDGVIFDTQGKIIGITPPEMIPMGTYNKLLGTLNTKGEVISEEGLPIGRILGDGTIVSTDLKIIGAGIPLVSVMDDMGVIIGQVQKDGMVVNATGEVIGRVLADATVVNLQDKKIGTLRPWGGVIALPGAFIGVVIGDGSVVNIDNKKIGRISTSGLAIGQDLNVIGAVVPKGIAIGASCQALGTLVSSGKITDTYQQNIGYALPDNTVVDASKKEIIGYIVPQGVIVNNENEVVGFVDAEGHAIDNASQLIGCIMQDGVVMAGSKVVGHVMSYHGEHVIGYGCAELGTVYPDGRVLNKNQETIGNMTLDGYVRNMKNAVIGTIVPRAMVLSSGCQPLGLLAVNGRVSSFTGQVLGCMTPEKDVMDKDGKIIGSLPRMGVIPDAEGNLTGYVLLNGRLNTTQTCAPKNSIIQAAVALDDKGEVLGESVIGNKVFNTNGTETGRLLPNRFIMGNNGLLKGYLPVAGTVFSQTGLIMGRYIPSWGAVYDTQGQKIAKLFPGNMALSGQGKIIGGLIADNQNFANKQGLPFGMLYVNGLLMNENADIVGAVRADGSVVGKDGDLLGAHIPSGKTVISFTGQKLGVVADNGVVVSEQGIQLGALKNQNFFMDDTGVQGYVLDESAVPLGLNGILGIITGTEVIGQNKTNIGKLTPGGLVISATGDIIGRAVGFKPFIDKNGQVIGFLSFQGKLQDTQGTVLGDVLTNGIVLDKNGHYLGGVNHTNTIVNFHGDFVARSVLGTLLGPQNTPLGTFKGNHFVYDDKDQILGYALPQGMGVDLRGALIGLTDITGSLIDAQGVLTGHIMPSYQVIKEDKIVGSYVPLDSLALNEQQKITGLIGQNGSIVDTQSHPVGKVISPVLTLDKNGSFLGKLVQTDTFFKAPFSADISGGILPSGRAVSLTEEMALGYLASDNQVLNFQHQGLGFAPKAGVAFQWDLSVPGAVLPDLTVINSNDTVRSITGANIIISPEKKPQGIQQYPTLWVDTYSQPLGFSSMGAHVVNFQAERLGIIVPGLGVLSAQNSLIGTSLPQGIIMDDKGTEVAFVRADGAALKDGNVIGWMLNSGDMVEQEKLPMPYKGHLVETGVAVGLKGDVLGRISMTGKVLDNDNRKIATVADDGFIIDEHQKTLGAVVPFALAVDKAGEVIGTVSFNGTVVNDTQESPSKIATNGIVKGKNYLSSVGYVVPQGVIIKGCQSVGAVLPNGQVIDGTQNIIGRLKINGTAVDDKENDIGYLPPVGPVFNANGVFVGRVMANGTFVDIQGNDAGCPQSDGRIINTAGAPVGYAVQRGVVICSSGMLGRMLWNGNVLDGAGQEMGHILGDGKGTVELNEKNDDLTCHLSPARRQVLFNAVGNVIGSLDKDGTFYDLEGQGIFTVLDSGDIVNIQSDKKVAKITETGELVDLQDRKLDEIMIMQDMGSNFIGILSGCEVLNDIGEKIGSVQPDSTIIDTNGNLIANIKSGNQLFAPNGSKMGRIGGTSTNLSACGVQGNAASATAETGAFPGRRIFIGGDMYSVSSTGTIIDDNGNVIGYMGPDGKPYLLHNNKPFPETEDLDFDFVSEPERQRPQFGKNFSYQPQQIEDMKTKLIEKRGLMKSKLSDNTSLIKPDDRILAKAALTKHDNKDWGLDKNISTWRVDMSRMLLKDKAIPAVLVHSIDSRYAGVPVTAIVERHIYSESGRNILIPAGSRLIGKAASGAGENRVAKINITWERLIRPDGSAFLFSGNSGDAQGRGGVAAYLDDQVLSAYGKPLLISILTSTATYLTATSDTAVTTESGDKYTTDKAEALADARENLIDTMDQIFQQLVEESMSTPAIVYVPSGTRLTVYSTEDLWLRSGEDDEEAYLQEHGADAKQTRSPKLDSWEKKRPGQPYLEPPENSEISTDNDVYGKEDTFKESETLYTPDTEETTSITSETVKTDATEKTTDDLENRVRKPVLPKEGEGRNF